MEKINQLSKGQKSYLTRIANEFKKDAKNSLNEISELKNTLDNEIILNEDIRVLFEEKEKEIKEKVDRIEDFHTLIFEGDEDENIISEEIEGFVEQFKNHKNEIDELKEDIDNYKNELFGYEDVEGNEVSGIKQKIEGFKQEIDSSIEKNATKQEELFNKIEGLLKGASTVALAKAFKDHKDSFKTTNRIWLALFVISIFSMMGLSLWGFIHANYEFKDMWKYTLGNLPSLGGAIWLAIYSSKQRSQNKRLQQEYAFKEDVAKIYYGLKKEIEELGETELGIKLNSKMLETILSVVGENPSQTLDNSSHNDKGPILEAINNLTNFVGKNTNNPL